MEGLKTTVSAQGKEVERLQRENDTLRGDMETHKLTVSFYPLSFLCFRVSRWENSKHDFIPFYPIFTVYVNWVLHMSPE